MLILDLSNQRPPFYRVRVHKPPKELRKPSGYHHYNLPPPFISPFIQVYCRIQETFIYFLLFSKLCDPISKGVMVFCLVMFILIIDWWKRREHEQTIIYTFVVVVAMLKKLKGQEIREVYSRKNCACFLGECVSMFAEWSWRQCLKPVKTFPRTCQWDSPETKDWSELSVYACVCGKYGKAWTWGEGEGIKESHKVLESEGSDMQKKKTTRWESSWQFESCLGDRKGKRHFCKVWNLSPFSSWLAWISTAPQKKKEEGEERR